MINHKKKTVLKWACGIVAALLVILAAGGWWMFGNAITAANSIEKLGEELYSMEYTGDYGIIFGRNYDWEERQIMIVHIKPEDGYESISSCCLDSLGFSENYSPDGSMMERIQALAAIYFPLGGMNEKDLVVDLLEEDTAETHQQTDKPDLTTTTAIRLLLDRAATVDEAISLLRQYDMNSSIGLAHPLSLSDASGKRVVVEYVDDEMLVK